MNYLFYLFFGVLIKYPLFFSHIDAILDSLSTVLTIAVSVVYLYLTKKEISDKKCKNGKEEDEEFELISLFSVPLIKKKMKAA